MQKTAKQILTTAQILVGSGVFGKNELAQAVLFVVQRMAQGRKTS